MIEIQIHNNNTINSPGLPHWAYETPRASCLSSTKILLGSEVAAVCVGIGLSVHIPCVR
jgi:hypothetical protein